MWWLLRPLKERHVVVYRTAKLMHEIHAAVNDTVATSEAFNQSAGNAASEPRRPPLPPKAAAQFQKGRPTGART